MGSSAEITSRDLLKRTREAPLGREDDDRAYRRTRSEARLGMPAGRPAGRGPKGRRRPGRFRRWVLRPLIWGLALMAVGIFVLQLLVDTRYARDWARGLIAEKVGRLLDRRVEIDDISFALLPLSVELWGVRVSGPADMESDLPFLEVPWAAIDADLQALQRNVIRLSEVRVERPRVYLEYLPGGESNILILRRAGGPRAKTRRFDVHIEHVQIERGELLLEKESVELSITADDVRSRLEGRGHLHVAGQVSGQRVVLRLPGARPVELAVSGEGSIRRGQIEIASAQASGSGVEVRGGGVCGWPLEDVKDKLCEIRFQGTTSGEKLAEVGYFPHARGKIDVDGTFLWRPRTYGWRMKVLGPRLAIWDRELEGVRGRLKADRHQVHFDVDEASYGGGSLEGTIDLALQEEGRPMAVDLDFRDVPVDRLLADQDIPAGPFAAAVSGNVFYRFSLRDGRRGSGRGEVTVAAEPGLDGLPIEGSFPLRIEQGVVKTDAIVLSSARQSVLARGSFDVDRRRGSFDYELATADLVPILRATRLIREGEPWPRWLPTAGEGRIEGTLDLAPGEASTELGMRLEKVYGLDVSTPHVLAGGFRFDRRGLERLRLRLSRQGSSLDLRGRVPFRSEDAPEDGEEDLRLAFDAVDWPLESIRPWLEFDLPVDGRISGHLDLEVDPLGSLGRLRAKVAPATLLDVPLDAMVGRLDWDHEGLRLSEVTLRAPAGEAEGEGSLQWPAEESGLPVGLAVDLRASGLELGAPPLAGYLPRQDLAGALDVTAHLAGSWDRPTLELSVEADALSLASRRLESRPSKLDVKWADGRVEASGRLLDMVTVRGGGTLDRRGGDLVFDLEGQDVAGLLKVLHPEPPAGVDGSFGGRLRVEAEAGGEGRIDLELDRVDVDFRGRRLANLDPVRVSLGVDHAEIASLFLEERATGSELFLTGRLGYAPDQEVDLKLQSTLANSWLRLYQPDVRIDGYLDLLGRIRGTVAEPYLDGQGVVRDGRIVFEEIPDFPHACDNVRGLLYFYPDGIVIDHLEAELANGTVRLEGRADLPRRGEPLRYQLELSGQDLRVRYPQGWLIEGDADLSLRTLEPAEGDPLSAGYLLAGRADLESVVYSEDVPLGFSQVIQETLLRQRLEVNPANKLLSTIQLNVEVDGPGALKVRNNLAELTGDVALVLRGHLAEPVFLGSVELAPGGELIYSSVDYEIDRGSVTFANPSDFDPEVDLVATTRVRDFDVILTLSGTMERLNASFASEPPLPALEVFELLATGGDEGLESNAVRRADEIGQEQSMSAASFLYGQAAEVIGTRVSDLFGFDKFRIAPLTGSGDNLSKARVTVGKRLSKDVFLSYSADPASTEEQRLRIEWQVGHGVILVLTQNGDNSYEADARWETSF